MWSFLWISLALVMSATMSVVTAVSGSLGARDDAQVYLLVGFQFDAQDEALFEALGVRETGPERGLMARSVFADDHSHRTLVEAGYWLVPGGVIAAICGIQRT